MQIEDVAARWGGIATRDQFLVAGFSGFNLTAAVRLARIRRRAHYAIGTARVDAIQAVRVGGRLAGTSAADTWGLWNGFDRRLHVSLPRNASRLRTNRPPSITDQLTPDISPYPVVLHWIPQSRNEECWRGTIVETVQQVSEWADRETAVAFLDTARTTFGMSTDDLRVILGQSTASARALVARSQPGSDSGPESVVRQRLLAMGVDVEQQVTIPVVGRVDMLVRNSRVVIEVDGRTIHSSDVAFENDRRRGAELLAQGHTRVQLSFDRVFHDWAWCQRMVVAAIANDR